MISPWVTMMIFFIIFCTTLRGNKPFLVRREPLGPHGSATSWLVCWRLYIISRDVPVGADLPNQSLWLAVPTICRMKMASIDHLYVILQPQRDAVFIPLNVSHQYKVMSSLSSCDSQSPHGRLRVSKSNIVTNFRHQSSRGTATL
jgi:hypothetical protein